MHTLYRFAHFLWRDQLHGHMNPADDKYSLVPLHFARYISYQPAVAGINVTRLQRASEGSDHSTGRCGDGIVQRGRVRLFNQGWINFVVLRNGAMDAERHRL